MAKPQVLGAPEEAERSELPVSQADGMVLEMKFLGILTIPNDGYSMVLMGKIGRSNDVLDSQKNGFDGFSY